jgi:hypothetical protein
MLEWPDIDALETCHLGFAQCRALIGPV